MKSYIDSTESIRLKYSTEWAQCVIMYSFLSPGFPFDMEGSIHYIAFKV